MIFLKALTWDLNFNTERIETSHINILHMAYHVNKAKTKEQSAMMLFFLEGNVSQYYISTAMHVMHALNDTTPGVLGCLYFFQVDILNIRR